MSSPDISLRPFALAELLAGFAVIDQSDDQQVTDITSDSRRVTPGSLFLAGQGLEHHGLEFLEQALARGAAAVAWEPVEGIEPPAAPVPMIRVENLARNAGLIANRFFGMPSEYLHVTGITGTNGKTSVASFIAQALAARQQRCGVMGTLGAGFPGQLEDIGHTTPDAVEVHRHLALMKKQGATHVAMEVSSHALDQARVAAVSFDTAILTNLSRDHLDYHGDMASYADAKRALFAWPGLRAAVINADDVFGGELLQHMSGYVDTLAYSVNGPVAGFRNLVARDLEADAEGIRFTVWLDDVSATVSSGLLGVFNVQNVLAAMGALIMDGMPLADAAQAMSVLRSVPGRMERLGGGSQPLVVVDYAHTPDALKKVLSTLRGHVAGRLIVVFGCGGDRDWGKRPFMGEVVEQYADMHIITNDNPRYEDPNEIVTQIRAGLKSPRRLPVILDREEAIRAALQVAKPGDCVLVAGKGHENYQIIGDEKLPFSDREVVARLLSEQGGAA